MLGPALIVVGIWIGQILTGHVPFLDQWTRSTVADVSDTMLYQFFWSMTHLGSEFFMVPFTITMALGLSVLYRDWIQAVFFAGGTLATKFANSLIKHLVGRERPSILEAANAEGFSFPSGHAMISLVAYGLLMYMIVKKLRSRTVSLIIQVGFAALITVIGMSRYFINVHYLTDVIAGFVIGFLCLMGLIKLYESTIQYRDKRQYQT